MKKLDQDLNKLSLKKETLSKLDNQSLQQMKGGGSWILITIIAITYTMVPDDSPHTL